MYCKYFYPITPMEKFCPKIKFHIKFKKVNMKELID